jgi:hypothetical protein
MAVRGRALFLAVCSAVRSALWLSWAVSVNRRFRVGRGGARAARGSLGPMEYGVVIRTRLNGTRIYGPYDAEKAIAEFQRWQCRIVERYGDGSDLADANDPQDATLATFACDEPPPVENHPPQQGNALTDEELERLGLITRPLD